MSKTLQLPSFFSLTVWIPGFRESESESHLVMSNSLQSHGIHSLQAKILEWVAFPLTRGPSRPRNWTRVSCIAGTFFTNWAMKEALALEKTWSNSNPVPSHDSYSHQAFCLSVSLMSVKRNCLGTTCSSCTLPTRRQEARLSGTIYSFLISHEK